MVWKEIFNRSGKGGGDWGWGLGVAVKVHWADGSLAPLTKQGSMMSGCCRELKGNGRKDCPQSISLVWCWISFGHLSLSFHIPLVPHSSISHAYFTFLLVCVCVCECTWLCAFSFWNVLFCILVLCFFLLLLLKCACEAFFSRRYFEWYFEWYFGFFIHWHQILFFIFYFL